MERDSSDEEESVDDNFAASENSGFLEQDADVNPTSLCGFFSVSANDKNAELHPSQGNSINSNPAAPARRKDPPELLVNQPQVVNLLSPPGSTVDNTVNIAKLFICHNGTLPPPPPQTSEASPDVTKLSDFLTIHHCLCAIGHIKKNATSHNFIPAIVNMKVDAITSVTSCANLFGVYK